MLVSGYNDHWEDWLSCLCQHGITILTAGKLPNKTAKACKRAPKVEEINKTSRIPVIQLDEEHFTCRNFKDSTNIHRTIENRKERPNETLERQQEEGNKEEEKSRH